MVRSLRVLLPTLVELATVTITVSTYLSRLLTPLPANISHIALSGTKITMVRPHTNGFTRDGQAYELKAASTTQDVTKPNMVELHKIDAKVEMEDQSSVRKILPKGIYDSKDEKLNLERSVLITLTKGYQGRLKEARVNIKTGHVVLDKPVEMKILQGTLTANRMEILNFGDLVRFDNDVRLTTKLNPADTKQNVANADHSLGNQSKKIAPSDASRETMHPSVLIHLPRSGPRQFGARHFSTTIRRLIRLPRAGPRYHRDVFR